MSGMNLITGFGVVVLTFMMLMYVLERRHSGFVFAFAAGYTADVTPTMATIRRISPPSGSTTAPNIAEKTNSFVWRTSYSPPVDTLRPVPASNLFRPNGPQT